MRFLRLLAALASLGSAGLQAQSILFVGNSFTFRPKNTGIGVVTDLNKTTTSASGVPGFFEALAEAGGKKPVVTMEAVSGQALAFHYEKRLPLITKPWDIVILEDHSIGPLVVNGDTASRDLFRTHVKKFKELFVAQNPSVKIWLYETWARPDLVKLRQFASMQQMQEELHKAYSEAAHDFSLKGWVPVGDSFLATVKQGLADNPVTPVTEGPLKIWDNDNHHQSSIGAYLAALLFYGAIYDADPRALPAENAVTKYLNLSAEDGKKLQAVAWEQLQPAK